MDLAGWQPVTTAVGLEPEPTAVGVLDAVGGVADALIARLAERAGGPTVTWRLDGTEADDQVPAAALYALGLIGDASEHVKDAMKLALRERKSTDLRRDAVRTGLIPIVNAMAAAGIVSLPGMMTGQILSGVSPLIAAKYQIIVMAMFFGTGGIAAAIYLELESRRAGGD